MRSNAFWTAFALFAVAGCSEDAPPAAPATAPAASYVPSGPLVGPADVKLSADEVKEIETIKDPEDRKLALAQKVCPVSFKDSDGHLGTMGEPIKKVINGQTVFLCCGSCSKAIEAEPAKYLAKFPSK